MLDRVDVLTTQWLWPVNDEGGLTSRIAWEMRAWNLADTSDLGYRWRAGNIDSVLGYGDEGRGEFERGQYLDRLQVRL
jgi:hypothetical protein